jgi:hypothetical protein
MRTLAMVWLILAASACSSPPETSPDHPGSAVPEEESSLPGITLTNPTDQTLYYAAFERKWSDEGLFIWAQCTDKPRCSSIAPQSAVRVPDSDINGYFPGAQQARVYFWELVPTMEGGYQVTNLRSAVVQID